VPCNPATGSGKEGSSLSRGTVSSTATRARAPDLLGYGFSNKPSRHVYSLLEQAKLTERLMESLGVTHCHVLEALLAFTPG
jgi:pimeloyl-ACP methyl ester carboxylesterase